MKKETQGSSKTGKTESHKHHWNCSLGKHLKKDKKLKNYKSNKNNTYPEAQGTLKWQK